MTPRSPTDAVIAVKIFLTGRWKWTYASLARESGVSTGAAFGAVSRCREQGLVSGEGATLKVGKAELLDLLTETIPRSCPARRGKVVFGMATAAHAPGLERYRDDWGNGDAIPLVWPCTEEVAGMSLNITRGETLLPIWKNVPRTCTTDLKFYKVMALVDVLRVGGAKEKKMATKMLQEIVATGEVVV